MAVAGDHREDGGHTGEESDASPLDRLQDVVDGRVRQEDEGRAAQQAAVQHRGHPEHVRERQYPQDDLAPVGQGREPGARQHGACVEIGVGQHARLGRAIDAAGVLEHRDVALRIDLDRPERRTRGDETLEAKVPPVPRRGADLAPPHDPEQLAVGKAEDARHRADDDGGHLRVVEPAGELAVH